MSIFSVYSYSYTERHNRYKKPTDPRRLPILYGWWRITTHWASTRLPATRRSPAEQRNKNTLRYSATFNKQSGAMKTRKTHVSLHRIAFSSPVSVIYCRCSMSGSFLVEELKSGDVSNCGEKKLWYCDYKTAQKRIFSLHRSWNAHFNNLSITITNFKSCQLSATRSVNSTAFHFFTEL